MIVQLVFIAIYAIVVGVGIFWFWRRSNLEPIKRRHWRLALNSVIYGVGMFTCMILFADMKANPSDYPYMPTCDMVIWIGILFVPMWITPILARGMILYYNCRLQQVRMNGLTNKELSWLLRYRFLNKTVFWFCLEGVFAVVSVVVVEIILRLDPTPPELFTIPNGCNGLFFRYDIFEYVLATLTVFILVFLCYRIDDGMNFKTEMVLIVVMGSPLALLYFINIELPSAFYPVPAEMWLLMLISAHFVISICYPIYLTYTPFYAQRSEENDQADFVKRSNDDGLCADDTIQITRIGSLSTSKLVEHIFRDEVLLTAFKKFAAKSWCVENIFFYQDARRYYSLIDDANRESEARRMMKLYFESSASLELNLDQSLIDDIVKRIQNKDCPKTLFKEVEKKILHVISSDTLRKWRLTEDFIQAAKQSSLATFVDFSEDVSAAESMKRAKYSTTISSSSIEVITTRQAYDNNLILQPVNF